MKTKFFLIFMLFFARTIGQIQVDTNLVVIDSVVTDTTDVASEGMNSFSNRAAIRAFYQKLAALKNSGSGKVNIVHIGDSHIQADLMTDRIRKNLQAEFGNGGRGFVFPHRLAGTNGSSDYKFSSNAKWNGYRNINSVNGSPVGLSGNALTTNARDFAIEFDAKFEGNAFNTVKIVTPKNRSIFDLAVAKKTIIMESSVPKKITHRIKNGEVLGSIADKYNISVSHLKKANGLKSDRIRAGKILKIPTSEMQPKKIERSEFIPLSLTESAYSHDYHSDVPLEKMYLLPANGASDVALNGVILENDRPGLIYHSIGVNGAKLSDYLKYPNFFEELRALSPDLIVVSLGTNESFDKMSEDDYNIQLRSFLESIRKASPDVSVVICTPPPSLFRRRYDNHFARDYASRIMNTASDGNFAGWDLYSLLGGSSKVFKNAARGLIGRDKVHYTHKGYYMQGDWFSQALLDGFNEFLQEKP